MVSILSYKHDCNEYGHEKEDPEYYGDIEVRELSQERQKQGNQVHRGENLVA